MEKGQELPAHPLLLLSDLDDTIKISHTQSKFITVYRGLFRSSAFAGMAVLYREILTGHENSKMTVVSSSPPAIKKKIEFFLRVNEFPESDITLRDWVRQPSILKYKFKSITGLVDAWQGKAILIGDDTEHDPEVLCRVAENFPDKILAVYVRIVKGRTLPEGCTGFFTAFDIACAELGAGRLTNEQVLSVGKAILDAEKNSRLIPWFSLKPPITFVPFLKNPDEAILTLWQQIHAKLQSIPRRKTKP
jgi:hypothetical protein